MATKPVQETLARKDLQRLGARLRESNTPSRDDLESLQLVRRGYDEALRKTQLAIEQGVVGIRVTTRLKTIQTLIEKLRRHPTMHLWQMQDIAGARVVREMSLSEQDALVAQIAALFDRTKIVDRRPVPFRSHGYRAVHVIVTVDNLPVEVQVRTALQDRWAQIVERLGDAWGRQIRYGEPPTDPTARVARVTRARVIEQVAMISRFLAACELSPAISCTAAEGALGDLAALMASSAQPPAR